MSFPRKVLHSLRLISIIIFKPLKAERSRDRAVQHFILEGVLSNLAVGRQSGLNVSQLVWNVCGEIERVKVIHSEMRQCFSRKTR